MSFPARESATGDPGPPPNIWLAPWIPAFAGMTIGCGNDF